MLTVEVLPFSGIEALLEAPCSWISTGVVICCEQFVRRQPTSWAERKHECRVASLRKREIQPFG
eukprot:3762331-Prymnesium_polylepis.2